MTDVWGNIDTDRYVEADELPNLPTCRVTTTVDPAALIRFDVTEDYADSLLEQVGAELDDHEEGDGLIEFTFLMDQPAYLSLLNGLKQLRDGPEMGCKQVVPERDEPDISVLVALNESQIETSIQRNSRAAAMGGPHQTYGQQFTCSVAGARLLATQLAAAVAGHEEPFEVAKRAGGDV